MPKLRAVIVYALLLAAGWTVVRVVMLRKMGFPGPGVHDEFSYLLGADLFAHGKFSAPSHPLPKFFESPHELMRPTYASKYPPGQALILAAGQLLWGSPFYGVIFETALMLFVFCVLMCIWAPLRWGLVASISLALGILPPMYWSNSYWGGSLAAAGGGLVLIAVGYLRFAQPATLGAIAALGATILFFTRPFEGAVFLLFVMVVFYKYLWSHWRAAFAWSAAPVIVIALCFTGAMNRSVTGHITTFPYVLHEQLYNPTPPFWLLPLRAKPEYAQPRLAAQHAWEQLDYDRQQPLIRGLRYGFGRSLSSLLYAFSLNLFNSKAVLVFMLLALPLGPRDPMFRGLICIIAACLLGLILETWHMPHYGAPVWAALWAAAAMWAAEAWTWKPRSIPAGKALIVVCLSWPAVLNSIDYARRSFLPNWGDHRASLLARMEQRDTPLLIFVRYPRSDWDVHEEWVFNGADIDQQRVVMAHDLGDQEDARLIGYYPNRKVLLLRVTDAGFILTPFGADSPAETDVFIHPPVQ